MSWLSMTIMVTPYKLVCSWNEVGMSYVKFPQAPLFWGNFKDTYARSYLAETVQPQLGDGQWERLRNLDGQAIRNANRNDPRESIRENRFAENSYFHNVRAIRANRLKDSRFSAPKRDLQKRGSVREPSCASRESSNSYESANRFARIGPRVSCKTLIPQHKVGISGSKCSPKSANFLL